MFEIKSLVIYVGIVIQKRFGFDSCQQQTSSLLLQQIENLCLGRISGNAIEHLLFALIVENQIGVFEFAFENTLTDGCVVSRCK